MKVTIEIQNCKDCPYSWSHTRYDGDTSVVCDKIQGNVGKGDTIHEDCPLRR